MNSNHPFIALFHTVNKFAGQSQQIIAARIFEPAWENSMDKTGYAANDHLAAKAAGVIEMLKITFTNTFRVFCEYFFQIQGDAC